jgi:hypothetical protein
LQQSLRFAQGHEVATAKLCRHRTSFRPSREKRYCGGAARATRDDIGSSERKQDGEDGLLLTISRKERYNIVVGKRNNTVAATRPRRLCRHRPSYRTSRENQYNIVVEKNKIAFNKNIWRKKNDKILGAGERNKTAGTKQNISQKQFGIVFL